MNTFKILIGILILSMFISCSKDEEIEQDPVSPLEWEIGRNDFNISIDDTMRNFIVHVPESYDGSSSYPVVLMLHGASGNGEKFYNISRWKEKGEEEGIITVYPTALKYKLIDNNVPITRWSTPALDELLENPNTPVKDDVIFMNELLDKLEASFNVDVDQIFCVGFSNGGGFIRTRLYIEMPERFTAFGTSGGLNIKEVRDIPSGIHKSLYMIIGSKDQNLVEGSGVLEEVPFLGENFLEHPFYGELFDLIIEQCSVENTFTEEQNPPKYNLLKFEEPTSSFDNELYLMIVNELQHNYANGGNNPHGIVATDFYWDWFQGL
jgi:predicted esterase